jgi:hypothetical protein
MIPDAEETDSNLQLHEFKEDDLESKQRRKTG